MNCKYCCYYGYSDNPDFINKNGEKIEHCLFYEIRDDFENAPCNEEEVNPGYREY